MSCPDAMYFMTDYSSFSKKTDKNMWKPLAKRWELNRVLLPEGVKHSFSCKDIGLNCNAKSALLPVCCQEEYAEALWFVQKFADTDNVTFELDAGSLLGGVKFNGLLMETSGFYCPTLKSLVREKRSSTFGKIVTSCASMKYKMAVNAGM